MLSTGVLLLKEPEQTSVSVCLSLRLSVASQLNERSHGRSPSGHFGSKPTCTSFKTQQNQHGRYCVRKGSEKGFPSESRDMF